MISQIFHIHCLFLFTRQIDRRFGVVTSFKGSYIAKRWSVELSHFKGNTNVGRFVVIFVPVPLGFHVKGMRNFDHI